MDNNPSDNTEPAEPAEPESELMEWEPAYNDQTTEIMVLENTH